jgi:acyl-CoA thioesterase FadM
MNVLLATFPAIGDDLRLATWISDVKRVQAQREYAIWLPHTDRQVARASARWAYIDRARGLPLRLHDELLGEFSVLGNTMPPRAMPMIDEQDEVVARGELLLTARDYEADSQQHINNCVYADWLSEGLHLALAPARDAGAQPGDDIRVTTLVSRHRSRALTVHQEIASARGDVLYVRARSTHLKTAG